MHMRVVMRNGCDSGNATISEVEINYGHSDFMTRCCVNCVYAWIKKAALLTGHGLTAKFDAVSCS